MTYCIADVHGCYDEFMELLDKINFCSEDTLYLLGDITDRGRDIVKCFDYVMNAPNVIMLMGNHEDMMVSTLCKGDKTVAARWARNKCEITVSQLNAAGKEKTLEILDFCANLPVYKVVNVNKRKFILVHGGIDTDYFKGKDCSDIEKCLEEHSAFDLMWLREKFYYNKAVEGYTVIFGHTPTSNLYNDYGKNLVWYDKVYNDKICIDCACVYGGNLCALRLEDMEVFYVPSKESGKFFN